MVKKVGIVGMGLMGQAFISNMRKSQFMIQGFDVDPKRMDELKDQGGTPVNTPADAAAADELRLEHGLTRSSAGDILNSG